MKRVKITLLLAALLISISCQGSKSSTKAEIKETHDKEIYDFIQIDRRGGGDKLFNLHPTASKDTLKAEVLRYDFKKVSETCFIANNAERDSAFLVFHEILKGERTIFADPAPKNGLLTGSWVQYYVVKDTVKTEITNEEVKGILREFELALEEVLSE